MSPDDPPPAVPPVRRPAWADPMTWVGVAVTVALLYWAAPKEPGEWAATTAAFAAADYSQVPVFLALLAGFYVVKAWRWTLLLRPLGDFGVRDVFASMMTGFGFNNVLPAHAGEGVRTLMFARQNSLPRTSVLATVALEKLFDLVAITGFLAYGLAGVEGLSDEVRAAGLILAGVTAVGVLGAAAYVFFTDPVIAAVRWTLAKLPVPEKLARSVVELAELGAVGLGAVRSPPLLAGVLISSVVQWAMNGLLAWIALRAFGLSATLPLAATLLGVTAFAVTVPSTPGYFGVIQGAFWLVLGALPAFADRQGEVFAASVFYHLTQYVPVTLVGLGCFFASGLRISDLLSRGRTQDADSGSAGGGSL